MDVNEIGIIKPFNEEELMQVANSFQSQKFQRISPWTVWNPRKSNKNNGVHLPAAGVKHV